MKNIWLSFVLLWFVVDCKSQDDMKVIYVYDALCGWCYGFSPVMSQFHEKYKDSVTIEVVSGGMVTGSRIGPIGEVASYISWAYKEVEKATNVQFGAGFLEKILKEGKAIFTSIPAAIALSVFKEIRPEDGLAFAAALQKGIYFDGIEPEDYTAYGKIAADFGLEPNDFIARMKEADSVQAAEGDFKRSADLGVTGFPTVFVLLNDTYYKIASGYVPFEVLERNFLMVTNR